MKTYTDIEQSKILSEFLSHKSADMYYWCGEDLRIGGHKAMDIDYDIPCWSLAALLDILPYPQLSKDNLGNGKYYGWMVSVYPDNCRYDSCWHDNSIDACYEMVIKLHELKML